VGLQPTVFYRWQKEFFENGAAAFEQKVRPNHSAEQERIAYLEKKIQTKDEVLAELMAEHVALKKTLCPLFRPSHSEFRYRGEARTSFLAVASRGRPKDAIRRDAALQS
jgi:hypothetical protein